MASAASTQAASIDEAVTVASRLGWPVIATPRYPLGGQYLFMADNAATLRHKLVQYAIVSPQTPVGITSCNPPA